MANNHSTPTSNFVRTIRKFFVSAFVVCSFVAYALHERFVSPDQTISASAPTQVLASPQVPPTAAQLALASPQPLPSPTALPAEAPPATAAPAPPTEAPQLPPTPTTNDRSLYKDGEYTGSAVDAFYGLVQVKAVIQGGKLADVQFLEYPNDRRTSIRINSIAMPYLTSEAIQAQTANVDVISGATLTSEAFAQSLDSALNAARS